MEKTPVHAVVLAAGKGTRMKSEKAKVLHEIFFRPMIHYVMDALVPLDLAEAVVVVGHQREEVQAALALFKPTFVVQEQQLGTGHAVLAAEKVLAGREGVVFILCGDTPLVQPETLRNMLARHQESGALLTVMTTVVDDPTNYGRIISSPDGSLLRIIEEPDADPEQKAIREINAGIYCVDNDFLFEALGKIGTDNKQGERYLTDIVKIANLTGLQVNRFACVDSQEILGVNSRVELAEAHAVVQGRRNRELMLAGVTMYHPETISIEAGVSIAPDTVIFPNTLIRGRTEVGRYTRIGPFCLISDCLIGAGVTIGAYSHLSGGQIQDDCRIKPHTARFLSE